MNLIRPNGCGLCDESCPAVCDLNITKSLGFGGCEKYTWRAYKNWQKHREDVLLTREMNRRSAEYDD
jgi:hypothetical protein